MKVRTIVLGLVALALLGGVTAGAYLTRQQWLPWLLGSRTPAKSNDAPQPPVADAKFLKISAEARRNLGLVVKPVALKTYWRTIQVPGSVVDRPGRSDRGVTSPAVGAVAEIHRYPGDTVRPGDRLFTLKIFSEYLQNTQSELFKAARETELIQEQKTRLEAAAKSGAVPEARVIELNNQLRRQTASIQSYRQDLLTRGVSPEQLERIAEGQFISTIDVVAPPRLKPAITATPANAESSGPVAIGDTGFGYEVQELKIELGEQVQAGQVLCLLANHNELYIEGHAFKQEAPFLERAAQNAWPIDVEFAEDDRSHWPTLEQTFRIRHLANSVDTVSRTFNFFIPLTNMSRTYEEDGQTFIVWRFRPGQRARLNVPVEEYEDVIVLPTASIVREGPEAYVFRQNGDLFDRRTVQILHQDRQNVVIAKGGEVKPGMYIAHNAAASLNRVLKAQASAGIRADVHVHADGSVHGNH